MRAARQAVLAMVGWGMTKDPSLDAAYALKDQTEVRALYRDWAETYEDSFVTAQGYQLHDTVAAAFAAVGGQGPVLDVGAGTGLGGVALAQRGAAPVDGLDLSPQMLDQARAKGVYRNLIAADITKPLDIGRYAGVVSAGTFTFGHVGPEGLVNLLALGQTGTHFVISVNAGHFREAGFEAALEAHAPRFEVLNVEDVRIYDDRADAEHRDDRARLLSFRLL